MAKAQPLNQNKKKKEPTIINKKEITKTNQTIKEKPKPRGAKLNPCQECGFPHNPTHPHNARYAAYQHKFKKENGRWASWADAATHCPEIVKAYWKKELTKRGAWTEIEDLTALMPDTD